MKNKAEDLLNKVAIIRKDMIEYVKLYVLSGLKNTNLLEHDLRIAWYDEEMVISSIVQIHSVDKDGDLFILFDYGGGLKVAEDVDVEYLSFEALCMIIAFYEDTI